MNAMKSAIKKLFLSHSHTLYLNSFHSHSLSLSHLCMTSFLLLSLFLHLYSRCLCSLSLSLKFYFPKKQKTFQWTQKITTKELFADGAISSFYYYYCYSVFTFDTFNLSVCFGFICFTLLPVRVFGALKSSLFIGFGQLV